jgi:hypothetical protein
MRQTGSKLAPASFIRIQVYTYMTTVLETQEMVLLGPMASATNSVPYSAIDAAALRHKHLKIAATRKQCGI